MFQILPPSTLVANGIREVTFNASALDKGYKQPLAVDLRLGVGFLEHEDELPTVEEYMQRVAAIISYNEAVGSKAIPMPNPYDPTPVLNNLSNEAFEYIKKHYLGEIYSTANMEEAVVVTGQAIELTLLGEHDTKLMGSPSQYHCAIATNTAPTLYQSTTGVRAYCFSEPSIKHKHDFPQLTPIWNDN